MLTWETLWTDNDVDELFGPSIRPLKEYLWLVRNTESPKQYHVWSLLSLTAALASNHTYLDQGIVGKKLLNLGVVLTGRPALRKSSAINQVLSLGQSLPLNIGPTDTAGARHGIMSAMQTRWQDDIVDDLESIYTLEQLAASNFDDIIAKQKTTLTRPSSIFFAAKELGRLLTAQTRELLDFFSDGIDGEPIFYHTKSGHIRIPAPLINLLGATTPGSLPHILPRDSHDHGLLSRLIFVYASRAESSVPLPPRRDERERHIENKLVGYLERIQTDAHGEIGFSPAGRDEYERLYGYAVSTLEFKLNAYSSRRPVHLAKVAAILCLLRGDSPYVIDHIDVGLAHLILNCTEQEMDGAYIGLDRSTDARMYALIREVLESSDEDMQDQEVIESIVYRSGFRQEEFVSSLQRLKVSKRLVAEGTKIRLQDNTGAIKARLYVESKKNRKAA